MVSKTGLTTFPKKMKCYNCNSRMEEGVELIISRSKTIPQRIMKCNKCGKAIVSSNEYERVRRVLHPPLFDRIKGLFKVDSEVIELFKGKIL